MRRGGAIAPCVMSTLHLAAGSKSPPYQSGMMRCYSMKYCPYAKRTLLILTAKNIKHDIVNINLQSKPEWFLEKNPLGKVPTLELDGRLMYESLVTCDYLEEAYPDPPLYPRDAWSKGQDRMLIELWNSKVAFILNKIVTAGGDREVYSQIITNIPEGLELFETELTKRNTKYFGGARPGMLDYMIWPWGERIPVLLLLWGDETAISKRQFPKLFSWMECMKEDPAVKALYINPKTYVKYYQDRPNGLFQFDMEQVP